MQISAMPSPRGTNAERLFVLRGRRPSPTEAHDVAGGLPDPPPNDPDAALGQILEWAKGNLTRDQLQRLGELVKQAAEQATDAPRRPVLGADDAAMRAEYLRRFPDANRLKRV